MSNELFIIIAPPLFAGIGYMGKYFVDKIETAKEGRKMRKLKSIENKLKHFFYPFHSNLKRENLIFQRILSFFRQKKIENNDSNNNELYIKIFWGLDNEILSIHNENQELIKNFFVEMHFSNDLASLIKKYDEHVSIYRILRNVIPEKDSNLDKILWPGDFGSYYPVNLLETIEKEMINLQNQQTYILQGHSIDSTNKYLKQFQYRKYYNNNDYKIDNNINNNIDDIINNNIDDNINNNNDNNNGNNIDDIINNNNGKNISGEYLV